MGSADRRGSGAAGTPRCPDQHRQLARSLTRAPDAADGATLEARVELVELLGGEGLVHLAAGPVELTARIPAPVPAVGEPFAVRIPPDRMHFFDATTTERIAH